jgi:hypothetical protein
MPTWRVAARDGAAFETLADALIAAELRPDELAAEANPG